MKIKKRAALLFSLTAVCMTFVGTSVLKAAESPPQTATIEVDIDAESNSELYNSVISEIKNFSKDFFDINSENGIYIYPYGYTEEEKKLTDEAESKHRSADKKLNQPFTSSIEDIENDLADMQERKKIDEENARGCSPKKEYTEYERYDAGAGLSKDKFEKDGKYYDYDNNFILITDHYERPKPKRNPFTGKIYLHSPYNNSWREYYNVYVIYIGTNITDKTFWEKNGCKTMPLLNPANASVLGESFKEIIRSIKSPVSIDVSDVYNANDGTYSLSVNIINNRGKEIRDAKLEMILPEGLTAEETSKDFKSISGYASTTAKTDFVIRSEGIADMGKIEFKVTSPVTYTVTKEYIPVDNCILP